MTDDGKNSAAELLHRLENGDRAAVDALFPIVYDELRAVAARLLRGTAPEHAWQPTELIHEAFVRLSGQRERSVDPHHFVCLAARAMRFALVDHARSTAAHKRGRDLARVTLDEHIADISRDPQTMLAIGDAVERLAARDPHLAEIVELRLFGGLEQTEIAATLGISLRSVERGWRLARAWLVGELDGGTGA